MGGSRMARRFAPRPISAATWATSSRLRCLEFNRVRVTLAEPNPHYLTVLANPRLRIAHPKHLMAPLLEDGEYSVAPLDVGAVGTGPFKLDRYEAGSLVRVVRNDDYWERGAGGDLPYLDGIDYVVMPNPTAMDAAFRTGRIDGGARGEGPLPDAGTQGGHRLASRAG